MPKDQKDVFIRGEGDAWFNGNRSHLEVGASDIVIESLGRLPLRPSRILEIGSSNGHRLSILREKYGAEVFGVDPSASAVEDGSNRFKGVNLQVGTADSLPFESEAFDLVIFGFCLYLVDVKHHFRAIAEADRVLRSKGALVIFDFIEPIPYFNPYSHLEGLRSHKTEWSRHFLVSPTYRLVQRMADVRGSNPLDRNMLSGVDVLLKDVERAFPVNPF